MKVLSFREPWLATASGCSEVPGEPGDMYEAGAGEPDVRHLTYITSVLPDLGQSHADAVGAGPAPWVHLHRRLNALIGR